MSLVNCCTGGCKIYRGRKENYLFQSKKLLMCILDVCDHVCAYNNVE